MDLNGILNTFPLDRINEGTSEALRALNLQEKPLQSGVSRFSGHDGGVAFRFFVDVEFNKTKSEIAGYEVFDEIELIEWTPDRYNHPPERVKFLPPELLSWHKMTGEPQGKYAEAYVRFKKGLSAPGMPLDKWGVLSRVDVATLSANDVFTVEQLAACPRSKIEGRFPQSIVDAFERAILHVNGKAQRDNDNEILAKMAEMQSQLNKLAEENAALKGVKAEPKKGGKVKVEDGVIKDD